MPEAPLHVEQIGFEGPELVLLHGFCETSAIWKPWISRLAGCRISLVDLPGFGGSPHLASPFTLEAVADQVISYLKSRSTHPVVVGHSLGGYVALAMAEQAPDQLAGLVLFHSTPYPDSTERKANRSKAIEFVREHGVKPFTQTLVSNLFFQKDLPAVQTAQALADSTAAPTVLAYLAAMRDRRDRTSVFKQFRGKKLVLAGVRDAIIPVESLRQFVQEAPTTALVEFENAGHMGMFEAPVATAQAVRDLLFGT